MGVGFSLLHPSLALMVMNRTDPARQGAAIGAYTSFWDLGLAVWGPVTGLVAAGFGYPAVFAAGAACALVAAALAVRIGRPVTAPRRYAPDERPVDRPVRHRLVPQRQHHHRQRPQRGARFLPRRRAALPVEERHRSGRQRPVRLRRGTDRLPDLVDGAAGRPTRRHVPGRARRDGDPAAVVPGTHPAHLAACCARGLHDDDDPRARRPDGPGLPRRSPTGPARGSSWTPRRSPARRRCCRTVPGIRPYYVHLVRDPRAVAHSWREPKQYVYAMSAAPQHRLLARVQPGLRGDHPPAPRPVDVPALRGLHRRPGRHRRRAAAALSAPTRPATRCTAARSQLHTNHTVTGNPDRFRTGPTAHPGLRRRLAAHRCHRPSAGRDRTGLAAVRPLRLPVAGRRPLRRRSAAHRTTGGNRRGSRAQGAGGPGRGRHQRHRAGLREGVRRRGRPGGDLRARPASGSPTPSGRWRRWPPAGSAPPAWTSPTPTRPAAGSTRSPPTWAGCTCWWPAAAARRSAPPPGSTSRTTGPPSTGCCCRRWRWPWPRCRTCGPPAGGGCSSSPPRPPVCRSGRWCCPG